MALTTQFWLAVSVGLFFFCLSTTLNAQIFASIREIMTAKKETHESTINSTIRTAYSFGWVIGPIIGSWFATTLGLRFTFFITAFLYIICLIPLLSYLMNQVHASKNITKSGQVSAVDIRLFCFALLSVFVLSGDTIKVSYLPLYIVENLKQQPYIFGSLLSLSAIVELVIFPAAGLLADKVGTGTVIAGGLALGIVDYALLAMSTMIWQLAVVQLLHVGVLAALLGLGVTFAQQLHREQPGLASSTYLGAQSLSTPLGSILGSSGVQIVGIPSVFFLPSAICMLSLVLFLEHCS